MIIEDREVTVIDLSNEDTNELQAALKLMEEDQFAWEDNECQKSLEQLHEFDSSFPRYPEWVSIDQEDQSVLNVITMTWGRYGREYPSISFSLKGLTP